MCSCIADGIAGGVCQVAMSVVMCVSLHVLLYCVVDGASSQRGVCQGGISRECKEHRVMRSSLPIHLNRHCFVLGQLTFEMAHNVHIEDQKHIPMRPSLFHIRPFVHSLFDLVRQWPLCGCGQCSNEWFQHGWQCPSSLR
jgi:hypothetical protein